MPGLYVYFVLAVIVPPRVHPVILYAVLFPVNNHNAVEEAGFVLIYLLLLFSRRDHVHEMTEGSANISYYHFGFGFSFTLFERESSLYLGFSGFHIEFVRLNNEVLALLGHNVGVEEFVRFENFGPLFRTAGDQTFDDVVVISSGGGSGGSGGSSGSNGSGGHFLNLD